MLPANVRPLGSAFVNETASAGWSAKFDTCTVTRAVSPGPSCTGLTVMLAAIDELASRPSRVWAPELSGSSRGARPSSIERWMRPYQSGVWLVQDAKPPCSCPTMRCSGLKSGEPDEPPSVVPRSQSSTRMWVPSGSVVSLR